MFRFVRVVFIKYYAGLDLQDFFIYISSEFGEDSVLVSSNDNFLIQSPDRRIYAYKNYYMIIIGGPNKLE